MAILLTTMEPECNQKGHKKGEEGREKGRPVFDQYCVHTLWPFAHLHLHTGIFFLMGQPVGVYVFNTGFFLLVFSY